MKLKVPYLKMRNGRPRWEPGPRLRDRGFKGVNLKDEAGQWLGMADAVREAERLNQATRQTRTRAKPVPRYAGPLLSHVWARYTTTPEFQKLKPSTRSDYLSKSRLFLEWAGDLPIAAIKRKKVKAFWRDLHDTRSHAIANGTIRILRLAFNHAIEDELMEINPAANLRLPALPPRISFLSNETCQQVLDALDDQGEFGIGDAFLIALQTAQRKGDILAMTDRIIENGRVILQQGKRDARVDFKATQSLIARLEAARERNRSRRINWPALVIDDRSGRPFNPYTFGHRFRQALAKAGIEGVKFKDTRDTGITRLYLAGNNAIQIARISGHDLKTVDTILRHYLAMDADQGDAAIDRYETWMKTEGVTV